MPNKKTKKSQKKRTQKKRTQRKKTKAIAPYVQMEMLDESQIMSDIEGRIPDAAQKMVYSFIDKQTGREIVGLSWAGSKEAEREFNKRKVTQITVTDRALISQGPGFVDVAVYAYDAKRKIGKWGMARGFDKIRTRTGDLIEDRTPSAKAMSKAQRNAINSLLPAEKVAKMILGWIRKGQVQQIEASKDTEAKVREVEAQPSIDWVEKLKKELYKVGARNEKAALTILKTRTGLVFKDMKITQKNAQIAYMMLINPKK